MQQHKWSFVGISRESSHPGLIAVCSDCGLVRSLVVVMGGNEDHIATGGSCPGRPGVDRTARSG